MQTFINTQEDIQWLKDVHIPDLPDTARSAVILGNEDWPESIRVYTSTDPDVDDPYQEYVRGIDQHSVPNDQQLNPNDIADAIDRMMDTPPDASTIRAMRQWFDKLISETSDAARIAELELCREYFTDPAFRQKLENYTFQATYKPGA